MDITDQKLAVYSKLEVFFSERGIYEPTASLVNIVKNVLDNQTVIYRLRKEECNPQANIYENSFNFSDDLSITLDLVNFLTDIGESVMAIRK